LTSTVAGTYRVFAKVVDSATGVLTDVQNSPATVTVTPDDECGKNTTTCLGGSEIVVTKNGAQANGSATNEVTAYARDRYGNVISGAPVATAAADGSMIVVSGASGSTGPDGTRKMTYSSTTPGDHQATVSVNGRAATGSPATLTFAKIILDKDQSTLVVSPPGPIAAGAYYTVDVLAKDAGGATGEGGVVSFSVAAGATFQETGTTTASCTTNAAGGCQAPLHVTSPVVGAYKAGATVNDAAGVPGAVLGSPKDLVFQAGPVCVSGPGCKTAVAVTVDGQSNDGVQRDIAVVSAFDALGNPVSGLPVVSVARDASVLTVQPAADIAPTNTAGQTTIWYTSLVPGGHMADVTLGAPAQTVPGSPVTLQFGKPIGSDSTFDVAPAGPLTVGTGAASTYTVTVTARDIDSHLLPGAVVSFTVSPSVPVWVGGVSSCTTGSDGTCQVKVYSTKSGGFSITGASGTTPIGSAKTVRWNADAPCFDPTCKTNVKVTTDYKVADGNQQDEATVQVFDRYDNPVPGAFVTSVGDPALTVQQGIPVTNDQGETTIWYTSRTAGAFHASVTIEGAQAPGSPVTVNFTPGAVDLAKSSLTVTPSSQAAGAPVVAQITLRDAFNNPVSGYAVAKLAASGTPEAGSTAPAIMVGAFSETSPGVYTNNAVTSLTVGTFTFTGTVDTASLSQRPEVEFTAGPLCLDTTQCAKPSGFEVTLNDQVADGVAQDEITAHAWDIYGNPVQGAAIKVTDTTTGMSLVPSTATATTTTAGTAVVKFSALKAGTYTAEGMINGSRPTSGVITDVRFAPGDISAANSDLSVSPPSLVVGNPATASVVIRDANRSPISNVTVTLGSNSANVTFDGVPGRMSTTCVTGADGTCPSVPLTSAIAGGYNITATVPVSGTATQIHGSPAPVTFTHDVVCMKNSTDCPGGSEVEVTRDGAAANNVATNEVTAHARDRYGNDISGVAVATTSADGLMTVASGASGTTGSDGTARMTYRSADAGTHRANVTIGGQTPAGSPAMLTFAGAPLDPGLTTMVVTPAGPIAAGAQYTATTTGRDVGGNLIKGGVVSFTVAGGATFTETGNAAASCTTDANGNCAVHITSATAGTYPLTATTLDAAGAVREITGSPKDLVFQAGAVCTTEPGCTSQVVVTVDGQSNDGIQRDIATVSLFDAHGNPVPGVPVVSVAANPSMLTVQNDIQPTNANGVTTIWYTSTVATTGTAGHQASVTFGPSATLVPKSPIHLQFGKPLDGTKSSFTVAPAGPLTVGDQAASTYTVTVTARDTDDHAVPGSVVTLAVTPSGPIWAGSATSNSCTTSTDGTCQVKVYSTKAGGYSITASSGTTPIGSAWPVSWKADAPCFDPGCKTNVKVTTDHMPANGSSRDVATVQVFDRYDNPVPGAFVSSVGDPALTVQQGISATNNQGESTIWYTTTKSGAHQASVLVEGSPVPGSPVSLNFGAGAWNAANSTLTVDKTAQSTGGAIAATATLLDDNKNPVPGVQVTFGTNSSTASITPATKTCTTGADGACSVTVRDSVAHDVTITATALQGSTATPLTGSPKKVTFTKPNKPVVNHPAPGEETNDTTPTFDGTADPGSTVTVTDENGKELCTAVADSVTGAWRCTPTTPMDEGDHTVTITATDPDGGTSDSTQRTFTVDTTPPDPPTVTSPGPNEPINDSTPTVSGTGEPGATVTVQDEDGNALCTATVQSNGSWSCTPPNNKALDDGPHTLTVTQTDPAGNTSPKTEVPIVVDTTPPAKPAIDKANGTEISGTAEPGSTVTVKVPGVKDPITVTADPDTGEWSIPTPPGAKDGTVEVTATDKAGNTSPKVTAPLDVTPPSLALDKANATQVSGTSDDPDAIVVVTWPDGSKSEPVKVNKDGTWNVPTPPGMPSGPITVTAEDPAGNTTSKKAELNTDGPGAPVFTEANATRIVGTADPNSEVVVTWPDGSKSQPVHVGPDGTWSMPTPPGMPSGTVRAVTTDQHGNTSPEGTAYLDTRPPQPPVVTKPTEGGPTNDTTPKIEGTGEPGSTITVKDGNGDTLCTATADPVSGKWSCAPQTPLDEGDHTITVTATDEAGNESDPTQRTFTVDTTPPDAPAVTRPGENQAVPSGTPEIAGKAEPGSTISVTDERGNELCTPKPVADAAGNWSCKPSSPLADGDHTITVTATDPAGNTSEPTKRPLSVDTQAPDPAVVTKPAPGEQTNDTTPQIAGVAEPGSTVTVTDKNGNTVCTATADKVTGAWSCKPKNPLPEGLNQITVVVTDEAGNESKPVKHQFVVDTAPPEAPILNPTNGSQIDGTAEPGSTVTIVDPGGKPVPGCENVKADATGHFACTPTTKLPDGTTVKATATDAAGNTSPAQSVTVGASWAKATYPVVHRGELQGSFGDRWVPGETIHVTVGSTMLDLGTITARADRSGIGPNFIISDSFELGTHTITWTGSVSGVQTATFKVIANPKTKPEAKPMIGTGGTVVQTSSLTGALTALSLLGAAIFGTTVLCRRRDKTQAD